MPVSITVFLPSGSVSYTEGVANVTTINVRYSFANVVDIRIFFLDGTVIRYYQCACVLTTSP